MDTGAGRQPGRQADRQAGRQASRQASRQAGRETSLLPLFDQDPIPGKPREIIFDSNLTNGTGMQSIYLHLASTNHGDSIVGWSCPFSFYLPLFSLARWVSSILLSDVTPKRETLVRYRFTYRKSP